MVGTHKWSCSLHPPRRQRWISLSTFSLSTIIDGWNAQMTLCSLHPPKRHIESVYQRSYNWWLGRTNDSMLITPNPDVKLNQFINVPIIDGWDAQMILCSLHPPRRHVESVYQRCYNWWLERTNDLCSLHPPRRHIESVYQQMTLCSLHPTQTSNWIRLMVGTHKWLYAHYNVILNQFINVPIIDGWNAQMTLLHPPRRHIESLSRSYNWWLERTSSSLHPPRRHIESVYQRSYNWWLERTNDSMLITPTQTSYWISLSTFL